MIPARIIKIQKRDLMALTIIFIMMRSWDKNRTVRMIRMMRMMRITLPSLLTNELDPNNALSNIAFILMSRREMPTKNVSNAFQYLSFVFV